jgi:N-methylhydantoinase A
MNMKDGTGPIRLGVDVGGTFTDLVALVDGKVVMAKVASTPRDQSSGVMRSVEASGVDPAAVVALAHGTTVATNALLERRGVRTALVTTAGFRDVLEIGRQNRPSLYDLTEDRPPPLVPRDLRFTVAERMGPGGPILPLDPADLERVVADVGRAGVEAVAVCLLFSFLHPEHEEHVGAALRAALPGVHVSLSSEVLPEFREYERFSTTAADAYLSPRLSAYLGALAAKVAATGMPHPLVMQSSGGVTEIADAANRAASCVLSGPAGGVVGAAFVAQASGFSDFLTFDMGGTSTDVAPVIGGSLQITTEAVVAGVPIKNPMVDVHTVSAGGGSIAWVDDGGALRVGPRSAGADPGPVAYGCGGTEPTVTDANLWLGYLADGACLGGELVLKRELSDAALEAVAAQTGLTVAETSLGVVAVANAEMARALRVISVERGLDPRDFALVAFGGAGPLHACALAEDLGMTRVLVPKSSGVLSALGLAISDLQRDYVRPWLAALDATVLEGGGGSDLEEAFGALEARGREDLTAPNFRRRADLRYRGQSFELTVEADDPGGLAEAFHAAHERRYGYRMEEQPVELVNLRLVATVPGIRPKLVDDPPSHREVEAGLRQAYFDGQWMDAAVFDRTRMGAGSKVEGPAIVEFPEATCVVRPEWRGVVDDTGTLILERS